MKKIAIVGASGFIGQNLINSLINRTDHDILAIAKNIECVKLENPRLKKITCDIFDTEYLKTLLVGTEVAYYFVHMMNEKGLNFHDKENKAALSFGKACIEANVTRVIYLGGLGKDTDKLSQHLSSRHETGVILRKFVPEVIEFRASMIIGDKSISFEIVKSLVKRLPIIVLPKESNTLTQPIGIQDVLDYLISAIDIPISKNEIVEIGGQRTMSYKDFIQSYEEWLGKHALIVRIPILPEWMAGSWLYLATSKENARVGSHMVESFKNEMIVTNNRARELFPNILPKPVEDSFVK